MSDETEADCADAFTEQTAQHLQTVKHELIERVEAWVDAALRMRGGTSELPALFERNRALEESVDAFNEAAADHTGTFPLVVGADDGEESAADDSDDEGRQRAEVRAEPQRQVSVVSRFDLAIVDADALLAAGRAAHRRAQPGEDEDDARAAVSDPALALHAITDEAGEPWLHVPGVDRAPRADGLRGSRGSRRRHARVGPATDGSDRAPRGLVGELCGGPCARNLT